MLYFCFKITFVALFLVISLTMKTPSSNLSLSLTSVSIIHVEWTRVLLSKSNDFTLYHLDYHLSCFKPAVNLNYMTTGTFYVICLYIFLPSFFHFHSLNIYFLSSCSGLDLLQSLVNLGNEDFIASNGLSISIFLNCKIFVVR